jgi:dienelactone hydrolase
MDTLRSSIKSFLRWKESEHLATLEVLEDAHEEGFTRKLISFVASDGERIESFLFEPAGANGRAAVVALHQHNSEWAIGKSEIAGLVGDPRQAFGPALARAGLTVLAPDAIGFESRRALPGHGQAFAPPAIQARGDADEWLQYYNQAMHRLVAGELLMTKVLADVASAVTVARVLVGSGRVGVLGHSYGGNVALFAAALDTRIAFACSSGAVCSFRHKLKTGTGLEMALVIPGFAARFDFDDLMRCIAPRSLLVVSSDSDPFAADAATLVERARPAFSESGGDLQHLHRGHGHALDADRFTAIVEWLALHA